MSIIENYQEVSFMNNLEIEHDRYMFNLIGDAIKTTNTQSLDIFNVALDQAWESYQQIKTITAEAIAMFVCNGFSVDGFENLYEPFREKLKPILKNRWKFSENHVSFLDVARCICGKEASVDVLNRIYELICDRSRNGMLTNYDDFNDDFIENPFGLANRELWLILYLFADDDTNKTIAFKQLRKMLN